MRTHHRRPDAPHQVTGRAARGIRHPRHDAALTLGVANGDEVSIHYAGHAPFPGPGTESIDAVLDFEIVGGTGRFDGATGGGEMWARITFEGFDEPTWAATWHWDGTIGY